MATQAKVKQIFSLRSFFPPCLARSYFLLFTEWEKYWVLWGQQSCVGVICIPSYMVTASLWLCWEQFLQLKQPQPSLSFLGRSEAWNGQQHPSEVRWHRNWNQQYRYIWGWKPSSKWSAVVWEAGDWRKVQQRDLWKREEEYVEKERHGENKVQGSESRNQEQNNTSRGWKVRQGALKSKSSLEQKCSRGKMKLTDMNPSQESKPTSFSCDNSLLIFSIGKSHKP